MGSGADLNVRFGSLADIATGDVLFTPQKRTLAVQNEMSAKGQKRTLPSKRDGLRDAPTVHRPELVVAGG